MPSIWNEADRRSLDNRLQAMQAGNKATWGQMSLKEMLDHLAKSLGIATGETKCAPKSGPFRYWPIRVLIIHVVPWPKGAPTAPELLVKTHGDWQQNRKAVREAITRIGALDSSATLHEHPAFGRISRHSWGVLMYRHVDHHLRQFGV